VLLKCFYWYGGTFDVDITPAGDTKFQVSLKAIDPEYAPDWYNIVMKLKRDLVDFGLRQIVADETRTVRELIIAKAFVHYEEGEIPSSNVSDPVGFDPQLI
jgi:His-Xaa-Ser system protein HxsD